jgi:hypothetical protein
MTDVAVEEVQGADEENPLETLRPSAQPVIRKLGKGDQAREYVQRPMGFFQKMRMYEILGEAIDGIASGEGGGVLRAVFSADIASGDLASVGRAALVNDADTFLRLIGKLASTTPDLLLDLYCLFLAVPMNEQPWARMTMELPPSEGGLSDDDGIDIVAVALDQNAEAIRSFFGEKIKSLSARMATMFPQREPSASSSPSRATRRATRKR